MNTHFLFIAATVVNEGEIFVADVLIENEIIAEIDDVVYPKKK